jgi:hypothetical protein
MTSTPTLPEIIAAHQVLAVSYATDTIGLGHSWHACDQPLILEFARLAFRHASAVRQLTEWQQKLVDGTARYGHEPRIR